MLNPNSLGAVLEVRHNLGSANFASQKAHDIGTGEVDHGVPNQTAIDGSQRRGALEDDVGGPFVLVDRPVVSQWECFEYLAVDRIKHANEPIEYRRPGRAQLLIHQFLRFWKVLDPGKTVVQAEVFNAGFIHLPRQPFAPVEADLDVEGEPGLNAGVHPAELRIDEIVVKIQAPPRPQFDVQFFRFGVALHLKAHTGLDARKNSDQAAGDTVLGRDLLGSSFLISPAGVQIDDGPLLSMGRLAGSCPELLTDTVNVTTEVFEHDLV